MLWLIEHMIRDILLLEHIDILLSHHDACPFVPVLVARLHGRNTCVHP